MLVQEKVSQDKKTGFCQIFAYRLERLSDWSRSKCYCCANSIENTEIVLR